MASHLMLDITHPLMKRTASFPEHPDPPRKGAVVSPTPSALLCVCHCVELAPGFRIRLFTKIIYKKIPFLFFLTGVKAVRLSSSKTKTQEFYTAVKQFQFENEIHQSAFHHPIQCVHGRRREEAVMKHRASSSCCDSTGQQHFEMDCSSSSSSPPASTCTPHSQRQSQKTAHLYNWSRKEDEDAKHKCMLSYQEINAFALKRLK